ncbi:tolB protein precursor protein [Lujinxingia litoralis]|uniref:TolB protein protein n=1 Tax=Lujinxingia litoralis TaxID=2211119 RepID=A0A328C7B5_9DELT|nr:PD40 domain-containing protein [Lujinxingia litoralis]RAL22962.1 tolB protein precursor protein [Lujinxingia litoralis]
MFEYNHRRPLPLACIVVAALAIVACVWPAPADAQIYVYPRRPNQSNVRYFDFEWHHVDILVGPKADTTDADHLDSPRGPHDGPLQLGAPHTQQSPALEVQLRPGGVRGSGISGPPRGYQASSTNVDEFPDPAEDTASEPPEIELPAQRQAKDEATNEPESPFKPSSLDDRSGGVRLYFYERERAVAERAAAYIEHTYRKLAEDFRYVPTRTLPYILYNSYQEFLQTNIFPLQEGVLGVTSRRGDLKLVLPYFGDHRLFEHVSSHEMVHQFTIQKAQDVARSAGVSGDPLDRIPLWFIEGIAEFYSLEGLDAETEMLARDLLLNPDPHRGYVMLDFFEDRPYSGLWTYKIGQTRVAFLEETYGAGTLQNILENSYRLLGGRNAEVEPITFRGLLADVTGDDSRTIAARFEGWLKQRSYTSFLDSGQDAPDLSIFTDTEGVMQTMTTSPDGFLMLYRAIIPDTGQVRLYLSDVRAPKRHLRVAADGTPGVESLHPVGPRTFDVRNDQLVFIASANGRDMLYLQEIEHRAERKQNSRGTAEGWDIDLELGKKRAFDLGTRGLLAAETPAFSPDGTKIAFVGLDDEGQKDLYLFEAHQKRDFTLRRLTHDLYAERGLSWGPEGLVYTSDATEHRYYNLFQLDPEEGGEPRRLTFEDRDHLGPRALADGRIFFTAYRAARANLYEVRDQGMTRRTDIVTGLFDLAPGPGNTLWALFHHRGQRRPARLQEKRLLDVVAQSPVDEPPNSAAPALLPARDLNGAKAYSAASFRNWELANVFGLLGASSSGVYGQLMLLTNDRLRNHALFINVLAFGDLDNTLADIMYLNQESRLIWGTGLFQDVRYRIEDTLPDTPRFLSGERFYGGRATLRYPLNRFAFIQGDLALGGVSYFLPEGSENMLLREDLATPDVGRLEQWAGAHEGPRFQASPSLSLGYNTIRYHPGTGPIDGTSAIIETTVDAQPFRQEVHGSVRLDAERYFPIYGRINLSLRGAAGTTYGGTLSRQFYLSSFDTLRGVEFGDIDYLLGRNFGFIKTELRFPLNFLLRVPLIDIEGLVGADFGGTGNDLEDLWRWRAFSPVAGLNFGLGPLVFRLHFAKPIDIGAPRLPRDGQWITNFSLGWRYW